VRAPHSTGLRAAAALVILAALSGCGQGEVYPLSPEAARTALAGTTVPDIAFGKSAHTSPGKATADGVAWTVVLGSDDGVPSDSGDDSEMMNLTAKLAPASGGVDVTVDVQPLSSADPKAWAKATSRNPEMFRYFRTVAREQVDAVLTHRDFRFSAVSGDLALAVVSHLPEIRKQMDDAAAAYERQDQETIHRAYDVAAGQGRQ
jgi:hypothetical protein